MHTKNRTKLLLLLTMLVLGLSVQAQRSTIPDAVAEGASSTFSTIPSGQPPTMADILQDTDVAVMGTIGEPRSYLSDDQHDVFTDYPITDRVFLFFRYESETMEVPRPETLPALTVTQLGGTVTVNGVKFTHSEEALRPLQPGTRTLLLLQRVGGKYLISRKYYGAFSITDGRLMPLTAMHTFAPEYRNVKVSEAVDGMMKILREQGARGFYFEGTSEQ